MSKFLAAIMVLGLSSFALAQDLSAEERENVLQRLRERKKKPATDEQDGDVELKKRILEKVAAKLATDRSALLKRIERIIDEELSKSPAAKTPAAPEGDAQVKELERKMRQLEEQKETLAAEMAKTKRLAADEALREEAKKDGPHDAEEVQEMFDNALELLVLSGEQLLLLVGLQPAQRLAHAFVPSGKVRFAHAMAAKEASAAARLAPRCSGSTRSPKPCRVSHASRRRDVCSSPRPTGSRVSSVHSHISKSRSPAPSFQETQPRRACARHETTGRAHDARGPRS
jgi:hypothetical protein